MVDEALFKFVHPILGVSSGLLPKFLDGLQGGQQSSLYALELPGVRRHLRGFTVQASGFRVQGLGFGVRVRRHLHIHQSGRCMHDKKDTMNP